MGRFDRVSLIQFCDNKSIVLDSIPDKCNRDTCVSGPCLTENCNGRFEKNLRQLFDEGGPHCKNCAMKNGHLKRFLTVDYRFNKNNITKFCEENGVVLDVIPDNCNSNTRVSGQCITESCDDRFEKSIVGLLDISGPYCKICTTENTNRKKEETNMKNRGVSHPLQSEEVKQKIRETNMKIRGVSHPSQSEEVKQKIRETNMKIRGVSYSFQSEEVKQKVIETNMKIRGVSNPLQSEEVKQKVIETNMKIRGVSNPFQSEEVKQKIRETHMKIRGVSNPLQSEEVKQKIRETNMKIRGVSHPLQDPEILERNQKARFKRKLYITPSGKEWYLQGYEPLVAPKIIEEYGEENITPDIKIVPRIPWFDEDGKEHYYFCDFYVDSHKLIIEVKSTWTAHINDDKIKRTRKASNELGYDFRLIVLDNKKEWIEDITSLNPYQQCSTSFP